MERVVIATVKSPRWWWWHSRQHQQQQQKENWRINDDESSSASRSASSTTVLLQTLLLDSSLPQISLWVEAWAFCCYCCCCCCYLEEPSSSFFLSFSPLSSSSSPVLQSLQDEIKQSAELSFRPMSRGWLTTAALSFSTPSFLDCLATTTMNLICTFTCLHVYAAEEAEAGQESRSLLLPGERRRRASSSRLQMCECVVELLQSPACSLASFYSHCCCSFWYKICLHCQQQQH